MILTAAAVSISLAADQTKFEVVDGDIVIQDTKFIKMNGYGRGEPILSYRVLNRTPYAWTSLVLQFDLKWQCKDGEGARTETITGTLGSTDEPSKHFVQQYEEEVASLIGSVDGCTGQVVGIRLIEAENDKYRVDGITGERIDFAKEAASRRKREAEAQARSEQEAAARRAALRQKCDAVYGATIHKKVADLTVEEARQIKTCELLDTYPAR
jgi:hypothetical protein